MLGLPRVIDCAHGSNMSLIGTKIGRIRIVESLGRGGMGEVFSGWDETLKRKVALKVIRDEQRLDAEARARFLREARILSQLDHPGICRIFEIIEDQSSDVLVLELIKGQSLKDALETGLEDSFKLYIGEKIAEALAVAHAKGVVHRDLKPDNVMLTDDGLVKVLDFGLANAVDDRLARAISSGEVGAGPEEPTAKDREEQPLDPTVVAPAGLFSFDTDPSDSSTQPTVQLSTPVNAETTDLSATELPTIPGRKTLEEPPEQTPRTAGPDPIFATQDGAIMGTVAYMSPEQARGDRITAASDMYSLGLLLQEMATGHSPYPPGLKVIELLIKAANGFTLPVTGLDPDLTTLIERLKAIAPEARPAAAETAERLWWIRGKKRRLWQRLAAAAIVVLLGFGAIKYTLDLRRERTAAVLARQEAESVSELLIGIFSVADPRATQGAEISVRELLDAGAARVMADLADQPLTRARLMHTIGRVYRQLGLFDRARPMLESAVAERRRIVGDDLETATYLDQMASVAHDLGLFGEAEEIFTESLRIRERDLGSDHPHVAASLGNLAFVYQARGDSARAEPLLLRALEIQQRVLGPKHLQVARSLVNLGELYRSRGELDRAESHLRQSLEIQEELLGSQHPDLATAVNNLAIVYHERGEPTQAEELYRRTLALTEATYGDSHPAVAISLNNLAELFRQWGDFSQAEPLYRRAVEIQEAALGSLHPALAVTLANRGRLQAARGQIEAADASYRRAVEIQTTSLGPDHPNLALTLEHRADLLRANRALDEARALYEQALVIYRGIPQTRHAGAVSAGLTSTLIDLGGLEISTGDLEAARSLLAEADVFFARQTSTERPSGRAEKTRIASLRMEQGRLKAAAGNLEQARSAWEQVLDLISGSDKVADLDLRCRAYLYLEQNAAAEPWVEELSGLGWWSPEIERLVRQGR